LLRPCPRPLYRSTVISVRAAAPSRPPLDDYSRASGGNRVRASPRMRIHEPALPGAVSAKPACHVGIRHRRSRSRCLVHGVPRSRHGERVRLALVLGDVRPPVPHHAGSFVLAGHEHAVSRALPYVDSVPRHLIPGRDQAIETKRCWDLRTAESGPHIRVGVARSRLCRGSSPGRRGSARRPGCGA